MTVNGLLQIVVYLAVLLACVKPLGLYMARVYSDNAPILGRLVVPVERVLYRLSGIDRTAEMTWRQYASALLMFSLVGFIALYAIQRIQFYLPLNPEELPGVSPDSSFNTAVSFTTNTNWQGYGGVPLLLCVNVVDEQRNPLLASLGTDQSASQRQAGGNMEEKEARFGSVTYFAPD